MQLPEGDRHTHSREFLEAQIAILMGGRIAEELFLRQMTSGAGNDIERATEIARRMVCEFGMSAALGPLAYRTPGNPWETDKGVGISEATAQRVDEEVREHRDARLRDGAPDRRQEPRRRERDGRGAARRRVARCRRHQSRHRLCRLTSEFRIPMSFDVTSIRQDFPILRQRVHGRPLVYLDNASTTHKPQAVIDRLTRFYVEENANVHRGVHRLSEQATEAYEGARAAVAGFLNAREAREIVFVRGTTEAVNLVAQSYGRANVGPRRRRRDLGDGTPLQPRAVAGAV